MSEAFESFYREVYGDRWPALRAALLREPGRVERWNRFAGGVPDGLSGVDGVAARFRGVPAEAAEAAEAGAGSVAAGGTLERFYRMDLASIIAAEAVEARSGDAVLDLCAAPGGKALILAEAVADVGLLQLNEPSKARRHRLLDVLRRYVPGDVCARIRVTGMRGEILGMGARDRFDRVLVDAPCSSEQHLMLAPGGTEGWTRARTRSLVHRQYALLCSALLAVRPGGRIVYATCSLAPDENDGVVSRLLRRKGDEVVCRRLDVACGERTGCGTILLPDRAGCGPIFLAVLERTGSCSSMESV